MNKKIKNIIICVVIVLIVLAAYLLVTYRFFNSNDREKNSKIIAGIKEIVDNKRIATAESNNIVIKDYLMSSFGDIVIGEDTLKYRVTIDEEKDLYIFDTGNSEALKLGNDKFVTLYVPDEYNTKDLLVGALTENGDVYKVELKSLSIKDTTITKLNLDKKIVNFVSIVGTKYNNIIVRSMYGITEDNKVYDLATNALYEDNMVNIDNMYIAYADSSIANNVGNILLNEKNEPYKLSTYLILDDKTNPFEGKPSAVILTNDNRLIYSINNKLYISYIISDFAETGTVGELNSYTMKFKNNTTINFNGQLYDITRN